MKTGITWIELLNEQAEWKSPGDLLGWLRQAAGEELKPSNKVVKEFVECANFMRTQAGRLHFGEPVDLQSINTMLQEIKMVIEEPQSKSKNRKDARIPVFRAKVSGQDDDSFVKMMRLTLFAQFAQFVAESLEKGADRAILRCEGLFRKDSDHEGIYRHSNDKETERIEHRYRQEIPILVETGLITDPEIQRCEDVFVMRPKAKFCSDACRFSTFQITKQLKDPNYLADKQRRYRLRHNQ